MVDSSIKLKQAFQYHKIGQSDRAIGIIQSVLKEDRENAAAWWLMANVLEDEDRVIKSLERVLVIDPNHAKAKRMMARLTGDDALEAEKAKAKIAPPSKNKKAMSVLMGIAGVLFLGLIALIPILALTGYGAPPPEAVVRDYVNAAFTGDFHRINELSCEGRRMPAEQLDSMLESFQTQLDIDLETIFQQIDVDTSEMAFTLQQADETSATVLVEGSPRVVADGQSMSVNEVLGMTGAGSVFGNGFVLTKEGHNWFVCM